MSGIGFAELLVLFVVGLLILGPERLPRVAAQLGRWMGQARRAANDLRRQLEREVQLEELGRTRRQTPKRPPSSTPAGTDPAQEPSEPPAPPDKRSEGEGHPPPDGVAGTGHRTDTEAQGASAAAEPASSSRDPQPPAPESPRSQDGRVPEDGGSEDSPADAGQPFTRHAP